MSSKEHPDLDYKVASKQESSQPTVRDTAVIPEHVHSAAVVQRARFNPRSLTPHDVLQLQRTIGNQAVQRLLVQPKPADNKAASSAQEVSRFAHDSSYIDAESGVLPTASHLQRAPLGLDIDPRDSDEEEAQRTARGMGDGRPANGAIVESSTMGAPSLLPPELGVSSSGELLSGAARAEFEARFGRDFSSVRLHSGPDAALSAQSLDARAYTAGSHIVFGKDQYSPDSSEGRALLAHELTHVVQQTGTSGSHARDGAGVTAQRDKKNDKPALATIPLISVKDRIADLKAQDSVLGGGDIPVLETLEALQKALDSSKSKRAEIAKAVDTFIKTAEAHPLTASTQSLIGNVGDGIAKKLMARELRDETDRILAHFHSTTSDYEITNLRGTKTSFTAIGSGYFPDASTLEGGFKNQLGQPLHTLQDFQAGRAPYVSVAMDAVNGPPLGTRLSIKEFPGVVFRVVDTGGAFVGKGMSRIDICTANKQASLDPKINSELHLEFAIPLPYDTPLPISY